MRKKMVEVSTDLSPFPLTRDLSLSTDGQMNYAKLLCHGEGKTSFLDYLGITKANVTVKS